MAVLNWADFTESVNRAEAAARKAVELGPGSAEAHAAMEGVHVALDRFGESLLEGETAIRINPNLVSANHELGWIYSVLGRFDEAIGYLRKARSLDPLDPYPVGVLIMALRVAGKVDEALEVVGGPKELHLRSPFVYFQTACCYLQKKDFDRASEALDDGLRFNPDDYRLRVTRGMLYALSGRRGEALDELRDLAKDGIESRRLSAQVWIRTALGDLDEAFEALMREAELHSWWGAIKYDPLFEALQKDPRFSEFSKKVGIPP
jgi:tetratricopeptide (TPR) repeat protein